MIPSEEIRVRLVNYLRGSCTPLSQAAERFEIDEDDALDCLLKDQEIELCDRCGWWHEWDELNDVDVEYVCNDCLTDEEREELDK